MIWGQSRKYINISNYDNLLWALGENQWRYNVIQRSKFPLGVQSEDHSWSGFDGIELPWWEGQSRAWSMSKCFIGDRLLFSRSVMSDSLRPHESQHARPPCPSPTPRVYSNSCPSSRWCHPAISSSVVPFSSCLQSCPASESQFFASGGQSIGVSASTSVLPMNTQDWFPLGCTGWISLQSKGLSRVFSNTTVQKHQFFSTQLSL